MSNIELLNTRAVIRITGEDKRTFLQGLISQDIDLLTPASAIFACLLTPQGKILFDFFIAEQGDAFLIDCYKDTAPLLAKRLTLYKLRAKVTVAIDESLSVLVSEQQSDSNGIACFKDPRHEDLGWRIIGETTDTASGDGDYDKRRIALGVPEFGSDFGGDAMFLLDVNYDALNGVNYKKGCFVGQEVTSRMKRKSEARKRTAIVQFDGDAPLPKGASITAGESSIGEILSSVNGKALALIRVDRWQKAQSAGTPLTSGVSSLLLTLPKYLKQD